MDQGNRSRRVYEPIPVGMPSELRTAIEKYAVKVLGYERVFKTRDVPRGAMIDMAKQLGIDRSKLQRWKTHGYAWKPRPTPEDITALFELARATETDVHKMLTGK